MGCVKALFPFAHLPTGKKVDSFTFLWEILELFINLGYDSGMDILITKDITIKIQRMSATL